MSARRMRELAGQNPLSLGTLEEEEDEDSTLQMPRNPFSGLIPEGSDEEDEEEADDGWAKPVLVPSTPAKKEAPSHHNRKKGKKKTRQLAAKKVKEAHIEEELLANAMEAAAK